MVVVDRFRITDTLREVWRPLVALFLLDTLVSPAPRAHHGEAPVLLDEGRHLRQLDVLVHADRLGQQIGRQRKPALRHAVGR